MTTSLFSTVLVANRGEIAVRIIRTLRALGIRSVAVHSDADTEARHVREADLAFRLGPAPARESYLRIDRLLEACAATGAEAVHPGYGFLAENAAFARALEDAGLVFIGPPVGAIEAMGDKIRAKQTVSASGVPVVPGRTEPGMTDDDLVAAADEVGFPVLVKPSAGGGGKGMRLVHDPADLRAAVVSARREAASSFGDDTLFVERFVTRPRHIEVQVLADGQGGTVHLGERECSLQRRHQKIIEEAPSVLLDTASRARIGAAAVAAADAVDYRGAGTVEFIVSADRPDEFFFMEMNTRLQVEHPVTELVTGIDLVEWQVRVAAGQPLNFGQDRISFSGHAVEARVYAEDPSRGFLPTGGTPLVLREPSGPGVRVDGGLLAGVPVATVYDPMLAKVIAHGADRAEALRRLDVALAGMVVLGVPTNIAFLRRLLAHPDVVSGSLDTGLVERSLHALTSVQETPPDVLAAAGLERLLALQPAAAVVDPWQRPTGWRLGEPAWATWQVTVAGGDPVGVSVRGAPAAAEVRVGDAAALPASISVVGADLVVGLDGTTRRYAYARDGETLWLARDGDTWALTEEEPLAAARHGAAGAGGDGRVTSPMPGTVIAVQVAAGDVVTAGQPLVVVEAMKMEHTLSAPVDGTVTELAAAAGAVVALGQLLAVVTAEVTADATVDAVHGATVEAVTTATTRTGVTP